MMGGRGGGSPASRQAPAATPAPAAPVQQQGNLTNADYVVQAYRDLERHPGDWVPLADIRERLGNMSRADQDAALTSLGRTPGVHLTIWDNTQALRPRDKAAALQFGGDPNHAMRIDPR